MITIKNEFLTVEISPLGGELQSIKDSSGREYLWQGDTAFWGKRAPNLFPYTGRTPEGKCTYRGQEYPLPKHGFVMSREMKIERAEEQGCTLLLRSDEETLKAFPFEFAFRIHYFLEGNTLICRYHVTNFTDYTMYFGLGAHPAFAVDTEKFQGYSLKFLSHETPLKVALSDDGYVMKDRTPYPLENSTLPLGGYPFEDSLAFTAMPKAASLIDEAGNTILTMEYADFDNLVLWRMADAPFFCIEPWCSLPSRKGIVEELSTQPGLVALEEGDFKAAFRVKFGE